MLRGHPGVITQLIRNFRRNVQASILMMTALLMPAIIGMAGLGLDASNWMMTQRMLQNSVDAAVLAAAWETAHGMSDNMQDAAEREAANNGWDKNKDGTLVLSVDTDADGQPEITGVLKQKADVYLSRIMHGSDIYIATTAGATLIGPTGDFCVLALSNAASGAITFQGDADLDAAGCGLALNSNSSTALDNTGQGYIANLNDVTIVGSTNLACNNGHLSCNSMLTNSGSTPDPYSNLNVTQDTSTCTSVSRINGQDSSHLSGGVYCGLDMSGGTLTLDPGVYYFTGDVTVTNGTITGPGVTIIMTSPDGSTYPNIKITGGDITLSPPTTGDTAGVALYVDRNAPTEEAGSGNNCKNELTGNGNIDVQGAVYVPSQCLLYTGSNGVPAANVCSRIIANTVVFSGSSKIGNSCSGLNVNNIGQYTVKLSM
ncbi:MAG TPA: TadE/TadG family type IV pilus assembly protein [Patescibacteria group bacterium]|nr:TadE/TadG family type IV pilus assembly protein [Patescibacteria group bacterium]